MVEQGVKYACVAGSYKPRNAHCIIQFQFFSVVVIGSNFNRRPEENPSLMPTPAPFIVTEEKSIDAAFSEDAVDDNCKCIICMELPKNATLIHGDSGHCCCCWTCAIILKQRGDPCPICRARIKKVIRQYNV